MKVEFLKKVIKISNTLRIVDSKVANYKKLSYLKITSSSGYPCFSIVHFYMSIVSNSENSIQFEIMIIFFFSMHSISNIRIHNI